MAGIVRMNAEQQHPAYRRIAVCVDDFGMHEGINLAALDLARRGRVSSISCLVDGPAWQAGSNALKASGLEVEIGLHLNFTERFGQPYDAVPLSRLILLAYARQLDRAALKWEIERQLEKFVSFMGRMPDFLDGHQHVHQLPLIREALIECLDKRDVSSSLWIRACCPPERLGESALPYAIRLKSRLIGWLGAHAVKRLAAQHGHSQNRHLLGVYGFDGLAGDYLDLMQSWLQSAADGDVLMCHPSVPGPWNDAILESRSQEYDVLASQAFHEMLDQTGLMIGRLQACRPTIQPVR
jgi:predicted glycoside hydrolase/deacetylase ChbG (UPF0249 family)